MCIYVHIMIFLSSICILNFMQYKWSQKIVTVSFFMPPEILRVGFFMAWPKRWGFFNGGVFYGGVFMILNMVCGEKSY